MKLAVATPHRGLVSAAWAAWVRRLEADGAALVAGWLAFDVDVVRARNRVVGVVLRDMPDITHVLWLDDDMYPENEADGVRVVREMLATGEDMIAAPYTNKRHPLHWIHQPLQGEQPDERGVMRVRAVGFGCTVTSRSCLEMMWRETEGYWDLPHEVELRNLFGLLYDRDDQGRRYLMSEDFSFCKRWRDRGGQIGIYARSGIICHEGPKSWSARDMPGGVVG